MKTIRISIALISLLTLIHWSTVAKTTQNEFDVIGKWNLTISIEDKELAELGLFRHGLMDAAGFPGWLEIRKSGFSKLIGYYVGYEGSARPISEVKYSATERKYYFTIPPQWMNTEDIYFEFTLKDDKLSGFKVLSGHKLQWTGVRAPSLTREKPPVWGTPKNLLDDNMSRWIIPDNNKFIMINGVLTNQAVGGNLVTTEKFNDFKLSLEFCYPQGSNSGVYLRGRYEVQIEDGFGMEPSDVTIGGIYGFIAPAVNASKKAGEWQTFEITLVGRHVSVVHNGIEVISNRPIPGITGGSLNSREGEPGPIMLQGDHGPIEFRKIVITPGVN